MLWATQLWTRPLQAASYVLCGWIVARTHRKSRGIVVASFMATVLVRYAWMTTRMFAIQRHNYLEVAFIALPLLILIGGWIERPHETKLTIRLKH
jgi:hypothetical protein